MSDSDSRPPVVADYTITINGRHGGEEAGTIEIPRSTWEALNPAQRTRHLNTVMEGIVANIISYGWNISDPADAQGIE